MICQAIRWQHGYAVLIHSEEPSFLKDADGSFRIFDMYHQALNRIVDMGGIVVSDAGSYKGLRLVTTKAGIIYVLAGDVPVFTDKVFRTLNDAKEMIDHHIGVL